VLCVIPIKTAKISQNRNDGADLYNVDMCFIVYFAEYAKYIIQGVKAFYILFKSVTN
jgi:hypothetical protein